jgi:hypothetical protein
LDNRVVNFANRRLTRTKTKIPKNMKKLALTSICALAVSGVAFAQGSVNWGNISSAYMTAQTNSTQYSPLFTSSGTPVGGAQGAAYQGGNGFLYALLYTTYSGSQATIGSFADLLTWSDTGLMAKDANLSFLAGQLSPIAGTTQATVPWAAGQTDSIVLVGWSANLGTDWATVSGLLNSGTYDSVLAGQNGFFGVSATGYIAPNNANPGVSVFAGPGQTYGLPINSLNTQLYLLPTSVVPEPATFALAGLGGLSLLLFRRRQQK